MNCDPLLQEFPTLFASGAQATAVLRELGPVLDRFIGFRGAVDAWVEPLDEATGANHAKLLSQVLEVAAEHRIFSAALPRSVGGSGASMLGLSVGLEHVAQRCAGIANLVATHGLALAVVGAAGNMSALKKLAQRIVQGEEQRRPFLLSTAATEPSAGSDLEDYDNLAQVKLESLAQEVPGGYRLDGRKIYVSNGSIASAHIVVMPTRRTAPRDHLHAFLVPAGTPGLTVVRTEHKLGQRASPAAELRFDGCFVPQEDKLSATSLAGRSLDLVLGSSRAIVGAFGAGIARGVYERCRTLAARPFASHGSPLPPTARDTILARMWVNAQLARSAYLEALAVGARSGLISFLSHAAFRLMDRLIPAGLTQSSMVSRLMTLPQIDAQAQKLMSRVPTLDVFQASRHGAMSKVVGGDMALENCRLSYELLGPNASRASTGLPKFYRDARLLPIYEGTTDICLLDIAKKSAASEGIAHAS